MADESPEGTGSTGPEFEGAGFKSAGFKSTGFEGTGFEGTGFEGTGFEGTGFSSQDEFIGTLGTFGEPTAAPPKWRAGRKAAAAVGIAVALGAGGYGIAVAAGNPGPTSNGAAALPADQASTSGSGPGPACGAVMMRGTAGTLKSDNGSTLTVLGPDNSTRTVTTTSSTVAVRIASGSLTDIANGDRVLVGGTYANSTLTAKNIVTGAGLDLGSVKAPDGSADWSGSGFASGTVANKTSSGFTVDTMDGGHVTVSASSSVTVETAVKISVSALRVGQRVAVSGSAGSNGAIAATRVEELDTTTAVPGVGGFGFGLGRGGLGPFGGAPQNRPSTAPSDLPSDPPRITAPNGTGGFGFRGHGKLPGLCGSVTPTPSTPSANSGA